MLRRLQSFISFFCSLIICAGLIAITGADARGAACTGLCETGSFRFIIPVYNNPGLTEIRTTLKGQIRRQDIFMVVSGNFNTLDIDWLDKTAGILREEFPDSLILVGTGGLDNISAIADRMATPIDGMAYIYEPGQPYAPEFDWDFGVTTANFGQAAEILRSRELLFVGVPTGRPVQQAQLQKYRWDYSSLGGMTNHLLVQTQTYALKGTTEYRQALEKLITQYDMKKKPLNMFPQITVDTNSPNGVEVSRAVKCSKIAVDQGFNGMLVWWSPRQSGAMLDYMRKMGRQIPTK